MIIVPGGMSVFKLQVSVPTNFVSDVGEDVEVAIQRLVGVTNPRNINSQA